MARIIDRWTLTNREIDNTNTFLILATIAGGKAREGDCSACSCVPWLFLVAGKPDHAMNILRRQSNATIFPSNLENRRRIFHLRWKIVVDIRSGKDDPEARPVLLYRGKERFLSDGVLALPVEDYLRALVPGRPPLDAF